MNKGKEKGSFGLRTECVLKQEIDEDKKLPRRVTLRDLVEGDYILVETTDWQSGSFLETGLFLNLGDKNGPGYIRILSDCVKDIRLIQVIGITLLSRIENEP